MSLARIVGKYATLLAGSGIVYSGYTQSTSSLEAGLTVAAGVGVAAVGLAIRTTRKIDYAQPLFFSEQIRQTGYDREIDEGCSAYARLVTLDVSDLTEKQTSRAIRDLVEATSDFDLCKLVQIEGFNYEGKRYLTIHGETHSLWQGSTIISMQRRVERTIEGRSITFVNHVPMPSQTAPHNPVNLGPYGSTGAPMQGIGQHPAAERLRKKGEIR